MYIGGGHCLGNPNPYNLSKKYCSTPPICTAVPPPRCTTPPICTAIRIPFVRQHCCKSTRGRVFWKIPDRGGGGYMRETGTICQVVVLTRKRYIFWGPERPIFRHLALVPNALFCFLGLLGKSKPFRDTGQNTPNTVFCSIWTPTSVRHDRC